MNSTRKMQVMIKKLNMIYKKGYMPEREKDRYATLYADIVNCFGHACFNLTNDSLRELDDYKDELIDFFRNFYGIGFANYFNEAKNRIRQVGLKIEQSSPSEKMQKNQWKIAYYVMHDEFSGNDLHFLIQERDGKWNGKLGTNPAVEVFDKLPKVYNDKYHLAGIYKITNPFIDVKETQNTKQSQEDMEM